MTEVFLGKQSHILSCILLCDWDGAASLNQGHIVYFKVLSITFVIPMVLNTILAILVQVLSSNKYMGMMILVAYFMLSAGLFQMGVEHNLWHFSGTPAVVYSDINQYGHFLQPTFWYNLY